MPKVGKKEFPYTKKGVAAAKKAAKKQGVKMVTGSKHEKTEGKKERIKEYGKK
jgi:hypothetical protein